MTSTNHWTLEERWGQQPTRSATGYVHLYVCPLCNRLYLRDPDHQHPRAQAVRTSRSDEQTLLTAFRATRSKLPRIPCRFCSVSAGEFSLLEEYHDRETGAFAGIVGHSERLDGRNLIFELSRGSRGGDHFLAPIAHVRDVKRLLVWLASHPLLTTGKIEIQPLHDPFEEVLRLSMCG